MRMWWRSFSAVQTSVEECPGGNRSNYQDPEWKYAHARNGQRNSEGEFELQREVDEIVRETLNSYEDGAIEEGDLSAFPAIRGRRGVKRAGLRIGSSAAREYRYGQPARR